MQTIDISARIGLSKAHMAAAKNYSNPVMLGPPLCDELVAGRPMEEVREILHRLAYKKCTLITFAVREKDYYVTLPIFPGTSQFANFPYFSTACQFHPIS